MYFVTITCEHAPYTMNIAGSRADAAFRAASRAAAGREVERAVAWDEVAEAPARRIPDALAVPEHIQTSPWTDEKSRSSCRIQQSCSPTPSCDILLYA